LSKGMMMTFGHSYVGRPAMRVKDADTSDEWNDYTKVKLDPYKLKNQGSQIYPIEDRSECKKVISETKSIELGCYEVAELTPPTAGFKIDYQHGLVIAFETIGEVIEGSGTLNQSSYQWNMGDGTILTGHSYLLYASYFCYPEDVSRPCGYTEAGTYDVSLTVTDSNGLSNTFTDSITLVALVGPTATFSHVVLADGPSVAFTNGSEEGDTTIISWEWVFGDLGGGISDQENPTYTYTEYGIYTVTLTVTDSNGLSNTFTDDIIIEEPSE